MPQLEQLLGQYPKELKLVFKNYPLPNHPFAMKAATAAMAADSQGKFWEFHDLLFNNYNKLGDQKLAEIAKQLGLQEEEFAKKVADPLIAEKIQGDITDGNKVELEGTPTIFINGKLVRDWSPEGFRKVIDKELMKARGKR